jgi:hypothetical protein
MDAHANDSALAQDCMHGMSASELPADDEASQTSLPVAIQRYAHSYPHVYFWAVTHLLDGTRLRACSSNEPCQAMADALTL